MKDTNKKNYNIYADTVMTCLIMLSYQHVEIDSKQTTGTGAWLVSLHGEYRLCYHYQCETKWHVRGNFEQHLSLYTCCIVVQVLSRNYQQELNIGTCESLVSCDIMISRLFLTEFLQKMHLKNGMNFISLKQRGRKWTINFAWNWCQWQCDVYKQYDVSLYQRFVLETHLLHHFKT